jgi:hypothetical protein
MNTATVTSGEPRRRLPSADWIAVGVVIAGLLASRLAHLPYAYLASAAAVLGPPLLRETGVLRDVDEYTRGIMHRAGLHAFLVAGALMILDRVLRDLGPSPAMPTDRLQPGSPQTIYFLALMTFLVSYLIQYWGARTGVFRILLAGGALTLIETSAAAVSGGATAKMALLTGAVGVIVWVGLAVLARKAPRAGGVLLTVMAAVAVVMAARTFGQGNGTAWGAMYGALQAVIVFGAGGIALLRR